MLESDKSKSPLLPEKAYLVVNAQVFPINKEITRIGRNLENDLAINDPTISRYHAEIHYEDSQFLLKDLESSSGTFLNNRKIKEGVLFSGDIILFSKTPVMFMAEGASLKFQADQSTSHLLDNQVSETPHKDEPQD